MFIDRPIQGAPAATNLQVRFIDSPATPNRGTMHTCCVDEVRGEGPHPVIDRARIDGDTPLGQPLDHICIAQPIPQIPADGKADDVVRKAVAAKGRG